MSFPHLSHMHHLPLCTWHEMELLCGVVPPSSIVCIHCQCILQLAMSASSSRHQTHSEHRALCAVLQSDGKGLIGCTACMPLGLFSARPL